ncbi:MAG: bifunctional nuclease family protein [Pirellulales bacterium]|nr:bifunctional nuclease family protein [Pirellulales bacterium]
MQCTHNGCAEQATIHLASVRSRRCIGEHHLCEEHARIELESYAERPGNGTTITGVLDRATCMDIDLIVITEINEHQIVYLCDAEGNHKIPILIGIFEATSLDRRVKGFEAPRPLTHDAMAMIIRTLDAEVQDVVVDLLLEGPACPVYHAKVRIRHTGGLRVVDIRPSDAFVIATLFGCPIFFDNEVLQAAGSLDR